MGKIIISLFVIAASFQIFPQNNILTTERASDFIEAIINGSNSLEKLVLPEELAISKRLGITYDGVKNKFLISYEIPGEIINEIKNKKAGYKINIEKLDEQFSILHFEVPEKNYETKYYFENEFLTSPPYYFYKDWKKIESDHFIFYVSESEYFNDYSIRRLEKFLAKTISVLNYSGEEKERLKQEKIIYILCKDEDEIEKLTGYKARGMCNLAYDYLITTFNCHYHELVHLLINFKLKNVPLYTHPFLQEGLAVALGGRGGKEPEVILNLGQFLVESGFLTYKELLNSDDFKNNDASMSYPLSGLYNEFMLETFQYDKYEKLYRKYSAGNTNGMVISEDDLPGEKSWLEFTGNRNKNNLISFESNESEFKTIQSDSSFILKESDSFYLIESKGNILISATDKPGNYLSKTFSEYFPDKNYNSEKCLIRINDNEIAVYNLYTNNLIANYVSGFSLDMKPVPKEDGFYKFAIRKVLIEENSDNWNIETIND
jgi:hypothetical protein